MQLLEVAVGERREQLGLAGAPEGVAEHERLAARGDGVVDEERPPHLLLGCQVGMSRQHGQAAHAGVRVGVGLQKRGDPGLVVVAELRAAHSHPPGEVEIGSALGVLLEDRPVGIGGRGGGQGAEGGLAGVGEVHETDDGVGQSTQQVRGLRGGRPAVRDLQGLGEERLDEGGAGLGRQRTGEGR